MPLGQVSGSTPPKGLRPGRVDGLIFGRRIGVHDLDHGSTRFREESFIGHEQCCPRRQNSINAGREVGRHFDSGDRARVYLCTLLSDVAGHANSQPTIFGGIRYVGIGYAARTFSKAQLVKLHTTLALSPEEVHAEGHRRMEEIETSMELIRSERGFSQDKAGFLAQLKQDARWRASTVEGVQGVFQRYMDRLNVRFDEYFPCNRGHRVARRPCRRRSRVR